MTELVLSGDMASLWTNPAHRMPETMFHLALAFVMSQMGLWWLYRCVSRAPILTLDDAGVTGFSLLGTKHIDWANADRLTIKSDKIYKTIVTIHRGMASATGGYERVRIPARIAALDHSLATIVGMIQSCRPGIPIENWRGGQNAARFLLWCFKKASQ